MVLTRECHVVTKDNMGLLRSIPSLKGCTFGEGAPFCCRHLEPHEHVGGAPNGGSGVEDAAPSSKIGQHRAQRHGSSFRKDNTMDVDSDIDADVPSMDSDPDGMFLSVLCCTVTKLVSVPYHPFPPRSC